MYSQHFGFEEKPFDVTPNPKFIYASQAHREALASLIYGIKERRGFIVLVGEVGTGKTLLLNTALDHLEEEVKTAYIYNTKATFDQFMTLALADFGIAQATDTLSQVDIIYRLNQFAIKQLTNNGNVVLIIDEAQNLLPDDLEKIRLLSNLETRQRKLVQIVLSGQPELEVKLAAHELRQLAQRINIKRHILPLNDKETIEYIHHRLTVAGYKGPELFTVKALDIIVNYSGGIPRKINMLCDNALLIAFGLGKKKINEEIVAEAISDLSWMPAPSPTTAPQDPPVIPADNTRKSINHSKWLTALIAGALVFGMGIWGGYFQSEEKQGKVKSERSYKGSDPDNSLQKPSPAPIPNKKENTLSGERNLSNQKSIIEQSQPIATIENGSFPTPASTNGTDPINDASKSQETYETSKPKAVDIAPKVYPSELGKITVSYGESLYIIIRRVYGEYNIFRLRDVLAVNPQLSNPNVLKFGEVIRFPARPLQLDLPKERPLYWVVLSKLNSLENGNTFVRNQVISGLPVRLITRWKEGKGLQYLAVLNQYTDNPTSALKLMKTLPANIASEAEISQLLEPNVVFFSNPLLMANRP